MEQHHVRTRIQHLPTESPPNPAHRAFAVKAYVRGITVVVPVGEVIPGVQYTGHDTEPPRRFQQPTQNAKVLDWIRHMFHGLCASDEIVTSMKRRLVSEKNRIV